jgi:hypothetical protein
MSNLFGVLVCVSAVVLTILSWYFLVPYVAAPVTGIVVAVVYVCGLYDGIKTVVRKHVDGTL